MKPTILIAATSHWFPAARLAMALGDAGCEIEGICPLRHPLGKVSSIRRIHRYSGLAPLRSFERAIKTAKPQLIIPADDLAAGHLHHVHRLQSPSDAEGAWICALIERSLGPRESFSVVYERATLMRLALEEGVRVPQTQSLANIDELREYVLKVGFPLVLKADGTCGGDGVKIARTLSEAEQAYRKLKAPVQLARAAKRAIVNHDKTLIWPSLLRRSNNVSGQAYVPGQEATSTIACWNGVVLAGLHFEVIKKKHAAGHATVMQLVDHREMSSAVEKIARRLHLSGVHGFDFMLESGTGKAFLIEMNPRTTQVGHLTLGEGRDIPAALVAAISGTAVQLAPKLTEKEVIALFPQEWARDPRSSYIRSGYHDVPWGEPALLGACVRSVRKQRTPNENCRIEFEPLSANRGVPADSAVAAESLMVRSGDSRYE